MKPLKYGDVVEFTFVGKVCRAMVVVVDPGCWIMTDEGTATNEGNGIVVFGFVGPAPSNKEYHQAGQTAKLSDPYYKVIG